MFSREQAVYFCLLSIVALTAGCAISASKQNSTQIDSNQSISANISPTPEAPPPARRAQAENHSSQHLKTSDSPAPTLQELKEFIPSYYGEVIVVGFYKPPFITGDFNGDHQTDLAVVVGAEERNGYAAGTISRDLFAGLERVVEGTTYQNMETGAVLLARPGLTGVDIAKHKAQLKPKTALGLLIILSGPHGDWREESKKTNYDRKFLLLDALFAADPELWGEPSSKSDDSLSSSKSLDLVKKGENCLPARARGEGIFSGDPESAGKVIYYNGKTFEWFQCGE